MFIEVVYINNISSYDFIISNSTHEIILKKKKCNVS